MAEALSAQELRDVLQAPETIGGRAFEILRSIAVLVNSESVDAQEIILRALEHRDRFGRATQMLDALLRTVGLFPYTDADALSLRDRLAYEFHRPHNMPDDFVFHKEQAEVYGRLLAGE